MEARARMMNIPMHEFRCMPIGELSDQIDAFAILNDYADESADTPYIPDLR